MVPAQTLVSGLDFRRFSDQGFLITPEMYPGNYDSRGLVTVTLLPFAYRDFKREQTRIGGYGGNRTSSTIDSYGGWRYASVQPGDALDSAFAVATRMGADALVRFDMKPIQQTLGPETGGLVITGLEVSGFAIKRR